MYILRLCKKNNTIFCYKIQCEMLTGRLIVLVTLLCLSIAENIRHLLS